MKTRDIERLVHRDPFQPFRLVLDDGEEIVVKRHRKAHVSGDHIALVGMCRKNGGARFEKFRLIQVSRVTSAEAVASGGYFD